MPSDIIPLKPRVTPSAVRQRACNNSPTTAPGNLPPTVYSTYQHVRCYRDDTAPQRPRWRSRPTYMLYSCIKLTCDITRLWLAILLYYNLLRFRLDIAGSCESQLSFYTNTAVCTPERVGECELHVIYLPIIIEIKLD